MSEVRKTTCELCGGEDGHFSACVGAERPGDWAGKNLWRLAAERGHRHPVIEREEWEGDAEYHLRHHAATWAESLRVGLIDGPRFAESMRGLLDELYPGVEGR